MKNKILVFTLVILIAIGGFLYLNNERSSPENSPQETQDPENSGPRVTKGGGSYTAYESGVLEVNADKRRVLFFFTKSCASCKSADSEFTENSENIPENVAVIRVNYNDDNTNNEEKELSEKYQITNEHSYVEIDKNGKAVQKWNGGNFEDFLSNL